MLQKRRALPAPSIAAASWRSRGIACSPAVTRMNVNPRPAQMLDAATDGSAVPWSLSRPGCLMTGNRSLIQPTLRQHADARLEQEEPHQAGDGDRRGDGRGEDRPECADAAHVLVGEGGKADAEGQPDRHGDQGELERHDHRVAELVAADDVDVLTPATGPAVVALGVAALLAEPHGPSERVEDEHRTARSARAPASARPPAGPASDRPPSRATVVTVRPRPGPARATRGRFRAMSSIPPSRGSDRRRAGRATVARRARRRSGRRRAGPRTARGRHLLDRRGHG